MDATILLRAVTLIALMLIPAITLLWRFPRVHTEVWTTLRSIRERPWATLFVSGAVVLTLLGQLQLALDPFQLRPDMTLIGLGAAAFWIGWRLFRNGAAEAHGEVQPLAAPDNPAAPPVEAAPGWRAWLWRRGWRVGLAAFAFLMSLWLGERIAPRFLDGFRLGELVIMGEWPSYVEQLGLWIVSTALLIVAVSPWADFTALARAMRQSWRDDRRDWLFVLGCTAAALAVRLFWVDTAIPVVFGDESSFARQGGLVSEGYRAILFAPAHLSHPWIFSAGLAPSISLFGRNLFGLRAEPVLMGALTVPAVYLLARWMFDRRVAAVAAVFMVGWSVHVHFSRLALNNIADPLFGALAFAFLWRGLQRGDRLSYALAGAALGLSQYGYVGARLYPLVVVAFVAALAVFRWRLVWSQWRGLVVLVLVFLIVTLPANYFLWVKDLPLTTRASAVSILQPREDHDGLSPLEKMWVDGRFFEDMGEQLYNASLAFNYRIDNSRFYAGSVPMFLPFEAVAFLLGAMWVVWRWRTPAGLLLILLIVGTVVTGGALMFTPPHFTRYLVAVPALVILLALGLVRPLDALAPGRARRYDVALGLAALLALGSAGDYFSAHIRSVNDEFPPRTWQIRDVAERINALSARTASHIIHADEFDLHAQEVIQYLCPERHVTFHLYAAMEWNFIQQLKPGYHAFFVSPGLLKDALPLLQGFQPDGQIEPWTKTLPRGDPFILYQVHPGP